MPLLEGKAIVIGDYGLNLRRSAGVGRRTILSEPIPKGETITIFPQFTEIVDRFNWIAAEYKGNYGFVVTHLIRPVQNKKHYIGIHIGDNGNAGDIINVARDMMTAGYPLRAALVVNDVGLAQSIKSVSGETRIFYRYVSGDHDAGPFDNLRIDGGGALGTGTEWFDRMWSEHSKAAQVADVHQMYNEPGFQFNAANEVYAQRVCGFELEFMKRADERGVKVTIGNYFPGTPEEKHWEQLRDAYAYAEAHGHWLCYHAYDSPVENDGFFTVNSKGEQTSQFFGLRPLAWLNANYPKLNVVAGEVAHFNSPRYRGLTDFEKIIREVNRMGEMTDNGLREWLYCLWSIKVQQDKNFAGDDFTPQLPLVARVCGDLVKA